MSTGSKNIGFGFLIIIFLIFGVTYLVHGLVALKNKGTVTFAGRGETIQINPWVALAISAAFLVFAIIGLIKIWKDKDKFSP